MKVFWVCFWLLLGALGFQAYKSYEPREEQDKRFAMMCVESGFDVNQCQFLYNIRPRYEPLRVDGESYGAGFVNGAAAVIKVLPKQGPPTFQAK